MATNSRHAKASKWYGLQPTCTYYKTLLSRIINQIKLIIMNRLASYANTCQGNSCNIWNNILPWLQNTQCHPWNPHDNHHIISCLHFNSENKPHPYLRVSWRLESIVILQGKITWQHDTHEPWRHHEWLPFAMTIKESGLVLRHPSAVFHAKTSSGSPWVTRKLSLLNFREAR
jgi:hypothetical protein